MNYRCIFKVINLCCFCTFINLHLLNEYKSILSNLVNRERKTCFLLVMQEQLTYNVTCKTQFTLKNYMYM